jgi:hypothetical protein
LSSRMLLRLPRGHGAHTLASPAEGAGALCAPDAGMKVTMMRHGNRVKHLGRPADQRKALIRGLVTEVIRNGAIRTTKVRRPPLVPNPCQRAFRSSITS